VRTGQLAGTLRRLDVLEPHDTPLDLRDRLLGDDDHVALAKAADPFRGIVELPPGVGSLRELRQPGEGDDRDDLR